MGGTVPFDPAPLQPWFSISDGQATIPMAGAGGLVVPADPQRVLLIMTQGLTGTTLVRPVKPAAANFGFAMLSNGVTIIDYAQYGAAVQQAWYGFNAGVSGIIYWLQVRFAPPG